jgi:hypothetical protein
MALPVIQMKRSGPICRSLVAKGFKTGGRTAGYAQQAHRLRSIGFTS